MKKLLLLLLCFIILLSSCSNKKSAAGELKKTILDPEKIELGGYQVENGDWYVDEKDPLIEIANYEREVKLSNGKEGTAYMKLPYINVKLKGAAAVSEHIKADYTAKYGSYFENPDDRIVKVDYSYEIAQDTLAILMREEIQTPEGTGIITYAFYYDILVDCELSLAGFAGYCNHSLAGIVEGLETTEWGMEYLKETGFNPSDSCITAITFNKEDDTFDVYCIDVNGITQTVVTVTPVKQEIDFSQFQID